MKTLTIENKYIICQFDELSADLQNLIEKAKEQVVKSYAPYSEFKVGAAAMLDNGEIFAAGNQENSAYPSGLCAERVAVFYANSQYPNAKIKCIAIAAFTNGNFLAEPITPCGGCRQVLLESENRQAEAIKLLLYGTENIFILDSAKSLLPLCFEQSSLQL
ncbi:MAG: cytidine deaminase [Paludibacter sp.]|jgi:cytidine deaminase|nr:cytidine deaminase [Paludibacter sp.]